MPKKNIPALQSFLKEFKAVIPQLNELTSLLNTLLEKPAENHQAIIDIYHKVYPLLETEIWSGTEFDVKLETYQVLFREQESLIAEIDVDNRHDFILSIPIADRPEHLRSCLESIYQLCLLYGYGGKSGGLFNKVKVIVAEDSKEQSNIEQHISLANEYSTGGLQVFHFGQQEQYEMLQSIPAEQRQFLGSILTNQPRERFYLKGQAANRNLSYLKFLQLTEDKENTLYYLVDSDQPFMVNRQAESGEQTVAAINYFYYINRIFSETDTTMLTGKLVGDPPVSPSVMAANFLQDVTAYLQQLAKLKPSGSCQFHQAAAVTDDAAYHDMAKLFGFENKADYFEYPCPLKGEHDNLTCLDGFSERVNAFFFGEHLTRKTQFVYNAEFTDLSPARTIYPGNYIVNYDGLKYIIPFGDLRLRMSGPTAGRLIQAEIKQRFASVNMPMLHTRTLQDDFANDFRPGVEKQAETINLTDEFERQFFGDLMLFTVVELSKQGELDKQLEVESIQQAINKVEIELLGLYQTKHETIKHRNSELKKLLENSTTWLSSLESAKPSIRKIQKFISNIELNFGEQSVGYLQIVSESHREQRKLQIIRALLNYRKERDAWDLLFP